MAIHDATVASRARSGKTPPQKVIKRHSRTATPVPDPNPPPNARPAPQPSPPALAPISASPRAHLLGNPQPRIRSAVQKMMGITVVDLPSSDTSPLDPFKPPPLPGSVPTHTATKGSNSEIAPSQNVMPTVLKAPGSKGDESDVRQRSNARPAQIKNKTVSRKHIPTSGTAVPCRGPRDRANVPPPVGTIGTSHLDDNEALRAQVQKLNADLAAQVQLSNSVRNWNDRLNWQNSALQGEKEKLEAVVKDCRHDNETLKLDNERLDGELAQVQLSNSQLESTVEGLRNELVREEKEDGTLRKEYASIQDDVILLRTAHETLLAQYNALHADHTTLEREHTTLQAETSERQSRQAALSAEGQERVEEKEALLSRATSESTDDTLQSQYALLQDAHRKLQSQHEDLQQEQVLLKAEHATLQDERATLQRSLDALEGRHTTLQTHSTLQGEYTALQKNHSVLTSKAQQIALELAQARQRIATLPGDGTTRDISIQTEPDETGIASGFQPAHRCVEAKLSVLRLEFLALDAKHATVVEQYAALERAHRAATDEYEALQARHLTLEREHAKIALKHQKALEASPDSPSNRNKREPLAMATQPPGTSLRAMRQPPPSILPDMIVAKAEEALRQRDELQGECFYLKAHLAEAERRRERAEERERVTKATLRETALRQLTNAPPVALSRL